MVKKGRAELDMSLRRFRRQCEQLSQFERGRIMGMMEAGCSAMRVARQLCPSGCIVRWCWDQLIRDMLFTRRPRSACSRQKNSRREDFHIVVFSYESRFNISSDDNRARVWRPPGERLNPAIALQRRTTPTAGGMTDHLYGTSAHAPQRPMVTYTGMVTVGSGPHGLLRR
ncbi:transposable element Tcb2 transposase [Trichonephila clavipes]|nr:transposable element Tcb2 transposase [Trichonephila clavipes]